MRRKFSEIVEITGTTCQEFKNSKKYISTGAVHHDIICDDETKVVDFKSRPSRANLEVDAGDILFAKMQGTRKTLLIDKNLSKNIYSTGFYSIKPKKGLITEKCLYYLVDSSLFLKEKDKNCSGATQKAINNYGLKQIKLTIPRYSDQLRIEKQLELLSNMVKNKERQIQLLDSLIKARFVEMFGEEHKEVELFKIGKISTGSTPSMKKKEYYENKDVPFYKPGDFMGNVSNIERSESFIDSRAENVSRVMEPGTIAVTCIGVIGKIGIIKKRGICNQQINFITPIGNINSVYLAYAINTRKKYMQEKANAPIVPILNKTNFSKVTIPIAPLYEQDQFASFVSQVNKSKFVIQKSLERRQFQLQNTLLFSMAE